MTDSSITSILHASYERLRGIDPYLPYPASTFTRAEGELIGANSECNDGFARCFRRDIESTSLGALWSPLSRFCMEPILAGDNLASTLN
jgi:hypothetical protein